MCQDCVHARASIAGTLMTYHLDMMTVIGYAMIEGAMDEYITKKHSDLDEEERNRIVTDVTAALGNAWISKLHTGLGDMLGGVMSRGARECERSINVPDAEDLSDNDDLDKLMQARESMEQILTDVNVQTIIDKLTDEGQDEES